MHQLIWEHYPDSTEEFRNSDQWFARFCHCFKVSQRCKTTPVETEIIFCQFHKHLLQIRKRGKYELADIADMDQTRSSFVIDVGKTYETTNSKDVWCKSGQSGLDKGQCTVQLAVFTDDISHAIPLLIFRGQGLCVKNYEREQWDKRVTVQFQKNAWCDEGAMVTWIQNDWGSNQPMAGSNGKLLIADIHWGQQTSKVKNYLRTCKIQLVNIPGDLTGYVQLLHVVVNKPFKAYVQMLSENHMEENLEDYVGSKIVSERCILMTKSCGKAWESISRSSVVREFKKCGISTNVDGSKNEEVHIEKIPKLSNALRWQIQQKEDDDGDGEDYVENESGTEENIDSKLSSNTSSDN